MAARLWPADAVAGAPTYPGRALRQTQSPFLAGATTARPLGALSGVRPGTPSSIATASSTTWTVTPFAGVIDGATAAIAGPYSYSFDTNQTGSVTAAGGSARVDRLDVQVIDPAEGGVAGANPLIQIVYTAGTPGLAAAPAQSHPLAQLNVPATGGGSPTVTWVAPYAVGAGAAMPFATKALLTAYPGSWPGQRAEVYTDPTAALNGTYRWSGSAWVLGPIPQHAGISGSGPAGIVVPSGALNLPNGVTIQTGELVAGTSVAFGNEYFPVVTFPVAFPTAVLSMQVLPLSGGTITNSTGVINLDTLSASQFRALISSSGSPWIRGFLWTAVGY